MREFSIFHLSKPEWDASKIGIKSNGGWAVFTDPITNKSLNSPRHPYPEPKIAYRRKTEEQLEQEEKIRKWREIKFKKKGNNFNNFSTVTNPLLNPPKDNYKEFKARKHIVSSKNSSNELDEFELYTKGYLTPRTMPLRPKKTAQLARDLQITSLDTQRYSNFSHSTARGCTPRSQEISIHYNVSDEILNEYDEEEDYEVNDTIKINQNESETHAQDQNEQKIDSTIVEKTEITFNDTSDIQNFTGNSIKSINNSECNNEIEHEEVNENDKKDIIDIDFSYDDKASDEEIETKEHTSLNDNIERIEIKAALIDDVKKDDNSSSISYEAHSELKKQDEGEIEFQNQFNTEHEKELSLSYGENDTDIEIQSESNELKNKPKQWKSKRTGKVISRKRTIVTSCSSFNNQKNSTNIDLADNRNKKIIVRSAETYQIQQNNQKTIKHTHPNDKPIHFKFRYNHPNNLRKSDNKPDHMKRNTINNKINQKSKNKISEQIKPVNKKLNDNDIKEKNKVNITDSLNNKESNKIYNSDSFLINDSNGNNQDSQYNTNVEILNNKTKDTALIENPNIEDVNTEIQNPEIENNSKFHDNENDILINSNTEINSNDSNKKDSASNANEDDQHNSTKSIPESTSSNKNNDDHITPTNSTLNNKVDTIIIEEEENNNKNNIDNYNLNPENTNNDTIISNDKAIENNNNINFDSTSDNDDNDTITINNTTTNENDDDNINNNNNIIDATPDNTIDEFNHSEYNYDLYDDSNTANSTSASSKITKKVINVYGHNYNDYNYYSNVIQNNTKLNLASSAPFEFTGTARSGRISNLSTEISHNLSPLPSTRRPATSTRQRFIERPECIGPERFFKGDDPAPARRFFQSANLVAEMRREEELKMLVNANVKRNLSKTVARKGPSLYERSLKPQEKRYCWPRDFAQFSVE